MLFVTSTNGYMLCKCDLRQGRSSSYVVQQCWPPDCPCRI